MRCVRTLSSQTVALLSHLAVAGLPRELLHTTRAMSWLHFDTPLAWEHSAALPLPVHPTFPPPPPLSPWLPPSPPLPSPPSPPPEWRVPSSPPPYWSVPRSLLQTQEEQEEGDGGALPLRQAEEEALAWASYAGASYQPTHMTDPLVDRAQATQTFDRHERWSWRVTPW